MLKFFDFIRSCLYFLRMLAVFFILILTLYWIENLTHGNWEWINFFSPFNDLLLAISDRICSYSFEIFGITFELKYLTAVIILTIISYIFKKLNYVADFLENTYLRIRMFLHKTEEFVVNKQLQADAETEQARLTKYNIIIYTELKRNFSKEKLNVNIDEQNKLMNDFIIEKTNTKPLNYRGGFLYQFYDFEKIDDTLDVMFKLINSDAPIRYSISIQVGNNIEQLEKIADLKHYGSITIAADTCYRYSFNKKRKYTTAQIGLFQYKDDTLELHEFKQNL